LEHGDGFDSYFARAWRSRRLQTQATPAVDHTAINKAPAIDTPGLAHPAADISFGTSLLECSPDCVKIFDLDGKLRYVNSAGAALMEIEDLSSVAGKSWASFWPAESQNAIAEAIECAGAGRVRKFTAPCATMKGSLRWWDVVVSPVRDRDGVITCVMGMSRDVTRQKLMEDALKASEAQFRALADNISQLAWIADATGSVSWYNQRFYDFTGRSFEELQGRAWQVLHHPDHVERVVDKFTACLAAGEVWEDTFPLRGKDGEYRWFLSRAMPMKDENGKVTLWCGTNTDITLQRDFVTRLDQKARLLDLSHEAIVVRCKDNKIALWNRGCADLYGYSREQALGVDCDELLKTSYSAPKEDVLKSLEENHSWSGEVLHVAKNGERVWVDCRKQLIETDGVSVILESNRDITERKKSDEIRDVLIAELNHRVKNTLSIMQTIAAQTARRSRNLREFVVSFEGRLHALAAVHTMLSATGWSGVGLRELLERLIAETVDEPEAVILDGEPVTVPHQTAVQLALIVHELATNALKHGALAKPNGHVRVTWNRAENDPSRVKLVWSETGVDNPKAPETPGFGATLIERSRNLPYLDAQLQFEPTGVVSEITLNLPDDPVREAPYFNPQKRPDQKC
jgi:PAS domain S-box-containing protein